MPKKNHKSSVIGTLIKYALIVPAIFGLIENLLSMAKEELADTKRRMVYIFILGMFALALFASSWLCMTALLVLFFMYLQLSLAIAILLTTLINFLLLAIVCLIISLTNVDVSLPETRRFIREMLAN